MRSPRACDAASARRALGTALLCATAVFCLAAHPAGASGGDILVADYDAFADSGGGVIRVSPTTGARTTVSANGMPPGEPAFANPFGIAVEADGEILVADPDVFDGGGAVFRVDPATGARTTVSANGIPAGGPSFNNPRGVTVEADGDILVADGTGLDGAVIRVDPTTGARTTVSANGSPTGGPSFVDPVGLAIEVDGDILVADGAAFAGSGGGVIRVDPITGTRTTVSANGSPAGGPMFTDPSGVAVEAGGGILVADWSAFPGFGGGVIRVDPVTGARTTVSANGSPATGPSFADPFTLALEADGDILVADANAFPDLGGGVIRVDPTTGVRTAVSQNASPPGAPTFAEPFGIAVIPRLANRPPDCSVIRARPSIVAHTRRNRFRRITLAGARDPDGDALRFRIESVSQDERVLGRGQGDNTSPDARLTRMGIHSRRVLVRAERSRKGDGRVYRIAYTVSDGRDRCSGIATVSVPRKPHRPAIDSAPPSFDSFTGARP